MHFSLKFVPVDAVEVKNHGLATALTNQVDRNVSEITCISCLGLLY